MNQQQRHSVRIVRLAVDEVHPNFALIRDARHGELVMVSHALDPIAPYRPVKLARGLYELSGDSGRAAIWNRQKSAQLEDYRRACTLPDLQVSSSSSVSSAPSSRLA